MLVMTVTLVMAAVTAVAGCSGEARRVAIYPEPNAGAQLNLSPALITQVTLPDNFVLRPDEFSGVVVDPARRLVYVGSRAGALLALKAEDGAIAWEVEFPGAISSEGVLADGRRIDGRGLADTQQPGLVIGFD